MVLARNVYQALEDIVGLENISEEPVDMDSYTLNWFPEIDYRSSPSKFHFVRPAAVVLPGSTEEVQSIVKACNRYQTKYKAFSTGYGSHAFPGQEGVVMVDLRRMNRILEIDAKNKYAVVEPYVSWMQLQAEAYKVGLATTQIQAGSQASVLANVTSCFGMNILGTQGGYNSRNALGIEWVLPTGELLKLGPPDSWFTSDGPGPSLRGVVRGNSGALGSLGIFTKCAIKLHDWPGPTRLETEMSDPPISYFVPYRLKKEGLELCKGYIPIFPHWENIIDFLYKLVDSEIAYAVLTFGELERILGFAMLGGKQGYDFIQSIKGTIEPLKDQFKYPITFMMFAQNQEELSWKQMVLEEILTETGGSILPSEELKMGESSLSEIADSLISMFYLGNDWHFLHGVGGAFAITAGYNATCEAAYRYQYPTGEMLKGKYTTKGKKLLNDGSNTLYSNMFDNAPYTYAEIEFHYDSADPESNKAAMELAMAEQLSKLGEKYGFESSDIALPILSGMGAQAGIKVKMLGELSFNFHIWQERIKRALDPNDICDRSNYGAGIMLGKELKL